MSESSIAFRKKHSTISRRVFIAGFGVGSLLSAPAVAQLGNLGDIGQVLGRAGGLSLNSLLKGRMPVTTSLPDAKWGLPERDQFPALIWAGDLRCHSEDANLGSGGL